MDTKTAVGAAGGISLTVAGAVSALVLTLGGGSAAADPAEGTPPDQMVEYVDQYGNPVALDEAPFDQAALPEIVVTTDSAPAMTDSDVEMMASPDAEAGYGEGVEPEEYEEQEDEEGEEYEEEDDD